MFGDHGLGGLPEEGTNEKSPKCLGGNLGDFGGILQRSQSSYMRAKVAYLKKLKALSQKQTEKDKAKPSKH